MPKVINFSEWKVYENDPITRRVFDALKFLAEREGKRSVDDFTETELRYYLGLEAEKDQPRLAQIKRGLRGVTTSMLRKLMERGRISLNFTVGVEQQGYMPQLDAAEDSVRYFYDNKDTLAREIAKRILNDETLEVADLRGITSDLFRSFFDFYSALRSHKGVQALQKGLDELVYYRRDTRFVDDLIRVLEERKKDVALDNFYLKKIPIKPSKAKRKKTHVKRNKTKDQSRSSAR